MRSSIFLFFCAITGFAAMTRIAAAEPIRILCIGDSITQGGKTDREEHTYRLPLQKLLHAAHISYDFIGSRNAGLHTDATWPDVAPGVPFDPDHEGYYGAKTAAVRDKLKSTLPALDTPDFALIHLGTNDQKLTTIQSAIIEPLTEIVAILRDKNPRVVILMGHLNLNGGVAAHIQPEVSKLVTELHTQDSPVIEVKHYEHWEMIPTKPDADTYDWVHPNPQGQQKMAHNWFTALKPFLAKP